jgi:polar amino acid transport system substrate-binding protein
MKSRMEVWLEDAPVTKCASGRFSHEMRTGLSLLLVMLLMLAWPGPSWAQDATSEIRVATLIIPPFVIKDGDHLTGFSIDLWEEIAAREHLKPSYQIAPDIPSVIEAVRNGKAEIGVSGIYFTKDRDKVIDYTYPIMNVGLQVMVPESEDGMPVHPLRDWAALVFSKSALLWLAAALIVLIIPAHIMWLLDRRNEEGISPTKDYFPGIFHSMFWAACALVSQVQQPPKQWFARTFGLIWMFGGIVFIALYTAQLTAMLTAEQIRGTINGPADLPGKRVGTLVASTSTVYLRQIKANVEEYPSTDEMYQALQDGKVDAVVLGAASLGYYASHEGRGRVRLVGAEFEKDDVGFVVPLGSRDRKRFSNELLTLREDGTYDRIYSKWFGYN